ncbi:MULTISPECIES: ATP-binding protein [Nitrospirillum]|uniref:histidine kinase n=1 Tax=Nitrospirillum amazonense TaxID=28077 RepID=A0A560FXQ5_9PROT|nr:ATP-binding protein [Nitrospirillum amazonense]MEC4593564.1 ATP-binding protein [Nitrospirillum amazonense]TWB26415.1 signal transduction histidine kinase [Nitrospirillum amazonense]
MTPLRVRAKWRPSLGMIVVAVLLAVAALPLAGLFFFRLYENQLVRQTEAELIAQASVLAAAYADAVERLDPPPTLSPTPLTSPAPEERFHPIEPALDLTSDDVLGARPAALLATAAVDPALQAIGSRIYAIAQRAQEQMLAGVRVLDFNGTILAGAEEVGLSLADVPEVAGALAGQYHATLRVRRSQHEPPPLYSMSRGTGVRVFVALPVIAHTQDGDRVAGVIYASRTPNNIFRHLYGERRKVALAGGCILAVILIIAFVFSRTITRPIHQLVRQTRELGTRGLDEGPADAPHYGTREIALLSQSFHDMAQRLSDRSRYITTFAAHVSHELKSPLTGIQGAAELLHDDMDGEAAMGASQRRRFLGNILADTRRLTALVQRLRDLAQADNPVRGGRTSLAAVWPELAAQFPGLALTAGGEDAAVAMSAENVMILFGHLADNAGHHGATALDITVAFCDWAVVVTVADNGHGISPANRDRVFDAFFTTRRDSGGTGMGLHIVQSLLRSHGGDIRLGDAPESGGAVFEVTLPRA